MQLLTIRQLQSGQIDPTSSQNAARGCRFAQNTHPQASGKHRAALCSPLHYGEGQGVR